MNKIYYIHYLKIRLRFYLHDNGLDGVEGVHQLIYGVNGSRTILISLAHYDLQMKKFVLFQTLNRAMAFGILNCIGWLGQLKRDKNRVDSGEKNRLPFCKLKVMIELDSISSIRI